MRLEPLYRVRFTYPESWAVGLDGGWQQMFFIAEGRCEWSVTGRFRGANFPRKEGAAGPFRPDFRAVIEADDGAVIMVEWHGYGRAYPTERRQIVGSVLHLADREPYRLLNDAVCVCTGEVRAPIDPGQAGPDLVIDVAELTVPAAIYPTPGYRIFVTAGRPVPEDPAVDPDAFRAAIIELTCALHEPVDREGFEIAAELYSGVDFEPSAAGRLHRLRTILEGLSGRTTRSPAVQEAVGRWQADVDQLTVSKRIDSTEYAMVKAFLDNVRTQPVNAAVAGLVDQYATGSRDAMRSARDVRNHLIHGNAIRRDLSGAVNDLQAITRHVIAGVIRDRIRAHPAPACP